MFEGLGRHGLEAFTNKELSHFQSTGLLLHIALTNSTKAYIDYPANLSNILTKFQKVFDSPIDLPSQRTHDHQIPL